ncbi:MAG TPA: hypothetical protein VK255_00165 [Patescibacteria group bacterium]|nr:hypothetical protein [Patescibacteria group bacterium]
MFSRGPKNTKQYHWTEHAKFKMQFYGLSPQRVLGIISRPARKEEGIVKNTIAVMKPINPKIINNKSIWKQEVWVMYILKIKNKKSNLKITNQNSKYKKNKDIFTDKQIKIISAWRYPGVSPEKNPIPEEILAEISQAI